MITAESEVGATGPCMITARGSKPRAVAVYGLLLDS
jgi:hypothetical protein